jgi:hypothetical protein
MKDDETEDYEIGYGKPPKSGQFKKGVSGNPSGRSRKQLDLGSELIRELNLPLVINENGKRKVIKKYQGIVKQLTNKGLAGNPSALRELLARWEQALEKAAEQERNSPKNPNRKAQVMSDEELLSHIIDGLKQGTSEEQMTNMLAAVLQQLGLAKPELFGLPVSDHADAV